MSNRLTAVERPPLPIVAGDDIVAHDERERADLTEKRETQADHGPQLLGLIRAIDFDDQQFLPWLSEPLRAHQDRAHQPDNQDEDQG